MWDQRIYAQPHQPRCSNNQVNIFNGLLRGKVSCSGMLEATFMIKIKSGPLIPQASQLC